MYHKHQTMRPSYISKGETGRTPRLLTQGPLGSWGRVLPDDRHLCLFLAGIVRRRHAPVRCVGVLFRSVHHIHEHVRAPAVLRRQDWIAPVFEHLHLKIQNANLVGIAMTNPIHRRLPHVDEPAWQDSRLEGFYGSSNFQGFTCETSERYLTVPNKGLGIHFDHLGTSWCAAKISVLSAKSLHRIAGTSART